MKPERAFFMLSVVFGVLFSLITPPFQVPDESVHFYRSYSIARGALVPEVDQGRVGDELPVSIIRSANQFTRALAGKPESRIDPERITSQLDARVLPLDGYFEHFPQTASYSPLPYVPQVVAISFATLLEASPVELLYAARVAVVITSSLILATAIALSPVLQWQMAFIALLPMTMALRASLSADAVTISLCFLLLGAILRIAFGAESPAHPRAVGSLLATAVLLPLTKGGYALLTLLAAIIPPRRLRGPVLFFMMLVAALSVGLLLALPWNVTVLTQSSSTQRSDTSEQIEHALNHPFRTASVLASDLVTHGPRYLAHLIGRLGVLDTPLPVTLLGAYVLALAAMLVTSDGEPTAWQRGVAAFVFLLLVFGITFALYAAWSPVGADHVEGIQGRYFIPFALLPFIAASNRRFSRWMKTPWWPRAFVTFQAAALTLVLLVLVRRYYV